jgi:hypothetical protein
MIDAKSPRPHRLRRTALLGLGLGVALLGLSGCVVYPAGGYYGGPGYVYAPAPTAVYVGGYHGYGYRGWGRGWR